MAAPKQNPNTRTKLLARASKRFQTVASTHSGAMLLSRYYNFSELMQLLESEEQGVELMKNYTLFDELFKKMFAEDYDAALKLAKDEIEEVFLLINTVMSSPLIKGSSPSSPGAEAEKE